MNGDLRFEDYKLKLDYLTKQYERLWGRFNFFLGVELALFGFLGYLTFNAGLPDATRFPALLGVAVSALWFVVGAEDRALVEIYRKRADEAAEQFAKAPNGLPGYQKDHVAAEIGPYWHGLRAWYWPPLSMTHLPATIGLGLVLVWLAMLVAWPPIARMYAPTATDKGGSSVAPASPLPAKADVLTTRPSSPASR